MFVRVYRIIKLIAEGMLVRSFVIRVEGNRDRIKWLTSRVRELKGEEITRKDERAMLDRTTRVRGRK